MVLGLLKKIVPASVPLPRPAVPGGVIRICVSGFGISHHTGRARAIASAIAEVYPDQYETYYYFDTLHFRPAFLDSIKAEIVESGGSDKSADHSSSPFCWLEETKTEGTESKKQMTPLGGRDRLAEWAMAKFDESDTKHTKILDLCREEPAHSWKEINFDSKTPGTAKTTE
mmetsp:Transcript_8830/g.18459  ORF Transcript_8830/g.18459 Transcript_8830/m.18459 type:complete len:171 (+) Transcript_8830:93-605(+)|eukprot:CAMPEP_0201121238 /NCGR_PEP_ID=MMETSP0850-20130426/5159_1 /ASSEMBLY_ACC=CAM_ASM_000622 /TAXON_ID=183588 /ORGANISM="Pseudo-nitzschia fraudulenta, Strain WWA7" /LENGTH=170 /DNA_ID=CAMNT_0047387631 /DNA_START=77 /DNA_END=589 /DNA_ORIENTATION=-